MKNGLDIDQYGNQQWFLNGKLHRTDGPALIRADGTQYWYLNGKQHRTDGPAVVYPDVRQVWYLNGSLHRTDGPAVTFADGTQRWYLNGKRARTDGPAVIDEHVVITISEVLHLAADQFLSQFSHSWLGDDNLDRYSCAAISACLCHLTDTGKISSATSSDIDERIFAGLEAMGLDTNSVEQYAEFPYNMAQPARYTWLKFAALIAEEQGV